MSWAGRDAALRNNDCTKDRECVVAKHFEFTTPPVLQSSSAAHCSKMEDYYALIHERQALAVKQMDEQRRMIASRKAKASRVAREQKVNDDQAWTEAYESSSCQPPAQAWLTEIEDSVAKVLFAQQPCRVLYFYLTYG